MRVLLVTILLSVFAVAAAGQGANEVKYRISVNGVGLGANYDQVTKVFGKPKKEETSAGDECRGGTQRLMEYDGVSFVLYRYDDGPKGQFNVDSIEIDSAKWPASGLKIGMSLSAVTRKLGEPTRKEPGRRYREILRHYSFEDSDSPGSTMLTFYKGKLAKISTHYIC